MSEEKKEEQMSEEEKQEAYVRAENGEVSPLTPEEEAKKKDIMGRIEHTLNKIRPYIQAEGGDLRLLDYSNGVAYVSMIGACAGCMMATVDISQGVQALVVDEVPEVQSVKLAPTSYY
jgi:Fe-S cluster biogenesis protein NfuA